MLAWVETGLEKRFEAHLGWFGRIGTGLGWEAVTAT